MQKIIQVILVETPEQLAELTAALIVVCSYITPEGETVNAIDASYMGEYPDLKLIDVMEPMSPL